MRRLIDWQAFKDKLLELVRSHQSPHEIALGVAVGVFICVLPVYGLHTVLAVSAAVLIRQTNKVAILVGTSFSIPPTMPFITWAGYELGRLVLGGEYPALSWHTFRHFSYETFWKLYYPLFIGSVILGLVLAVFFYFLVRWFFEQRRKRERMRTVGMKQGLLLIIVSVATTVTLTGCSTFSSRCIQAIPAGSPEPVVVLYPPPVELTKASQNRQDALSMTADYTGEKIVYKVSPFGFAEYEDKGIVELAGKKVRLVTLKTRAMGVSDLETIYIDPETSLPVRVERDVALPLGREYLVEEYSPSTTSINIKKYVGKDLAKEYNFKAEGPVQNAVFMPFSLRTIPELKLGQTFYTYFPKKFRITLVSVDEIKVPAGTFLAWHFVSEPRKFEVWISQDARRIPLEIKSGKYAMTMRSWSLPNQPAVPDR